MNEIGGGRNIAQSESGQIEELCADSGNHSSGADARSFELSSKIDQERIGAELKDGVITLILPKAERAKSRKITVR